MMKPDPAMPVPGYGVPAFPHEGPEPSFSNSIPGLIVGISGNDCIAGRNSMARMIDKPWRPKHDVRISRELRERAARILAKL